MITSAITLALLMLSAWYVFDKNLEDFFKGNTKDSISVSLWIVKSSTAGALIGAAAYFLITLSRALLHEATVLYARRHALRFGRLFVYLKNGDVDFEQLEDAFKWNTEFTTAFKDIQPDKISKTPLQKILELPTDVLKAINDYSKIKADKKSQKRLHQIS